LVISNLFTDLWRLELFRAYEVELRLTIRFLARVSFAARDLIATIDLPR